MTKLPKAVDEWQDAIDRMVKICDEMIKEYDYQTAAVVAVLKKRLMKLKRPKKGKRHG